LLDHKQRVLGFLAWLRGQPYENVLVVAHEETLRVSVAYFEGKVPDERLREIHIGNCEPRSTPTSSATYCCLPLILQTPSACFRQTPTGSLPSCGAPRCAMIPGKKCH